MRQFLLCLVLVPVLAACSLTQTDTALYLIDPPAPATDLRNRLGRIEVREVALPQYASGQEIVTQGPDGALRSDPGTLWADAPARAMTEALARQISAVSGATALAEPWPLAEDPARRLQVRVSRIYADSVGTFRLSGRYTVAPLFAEDGRDIVRSFDLSEPVPGEGAAAIAQAQSRAIQALARQIAQLQ